MLETAPSGQTVESSKQSALFRRLAKDLPALLRRRPPRHKVAKPQQSQRRLTAEQVAQLVQEYEVGDDMAVLATRWDLHRTTVAGRECPDDGVRRPPGATRSARSAR